MSEKREALLDKTKALIKRVKSYTKKSWDFEDYPTTTWKNTSALQENIAYGAGIINWTMMVAHGKTPEEAMMALKDNFNRHKDGNDDLPRPGSYVPIQFAATDNIDKYEETAVDFFKNILDMNYYDGWFSDGSALCDFGFYNHESAKKRNEKLIKKVRKIYNADIADIFNEPLWKIFERIEKCKKLVREVKE